MTQAVSHELASLLKDAGYDVPCTCRYYGGELRTYNPPEQFNQARWESAIYQSISAPSIAAALDWADEKGYEVYCDKLGDNLMIYKVKMTSKPSDVIAFGRPEHPNRADAYHAGLIEVCKLIISNQKPNKMSKQNQVLEKIKHLIPLTDERVRKVMEILNDEELQVYFQMSIDAFSTYYSPSKEMEEAAGVEYFVEEGFEGWNPKFKIGCQTFSIESQETKDHAEWYIPNLKHAFANLLAGHARPKPDLTSQPVDMERLREEIVDALTEANGHGGGTDAILELIAPYIAPPAEKASSAWISVEDRLPICWKTGDFDGKKSGPILAMDRAECYHVAFLYSGFMDGAEFNQFYDDRDFEIDGIIKWQPISATAQSAENVVKTKPLIALADDLETCREVAEILGMTLDDADKTALNPPYDRGDEVILAMTKEKPEPTGYILRIIIHSGYMTFGFWEDEEPEEFPMGSIWQLLLTRGYAPTGKEEGEHE